jgi:inorganic pyrophosphatase
MIDNKEPDAKIIAVPVEDPRFDSVQDLKDVNPHTLKEIEHFFQTYKKIQNKVVETNGFGDRAAAVHEFEECVSRYQKEGKK